MAVKNKELFNKLNNNMSSLRDGLYGDLTTKIATEEAEKSAKVTKITKTR